MDHETAMKAAIEQASAVRASTSPNPWVGAVVLDASGTLVAVGATQPPGGDHAEVAALRLSGRQALGGTLVVTLEPCGHHGRTPPCTDAIVAAGIARVVVGIEDPDPRVAGAGIERLRQSGIEVTVGPRADEVRSLLAPYLHHRLTGRPYVVLKLAASVDGRTAAPDGTSKWITGDVARRDVHRLRAESDAVLVGAGTVRADDPLLTVRLQTNPADQATDPLRVVLGRAPANARAHPCLEWVDGLPELLDHLGSRGVLQLLVEGGATVAAAFHESGHVDRYVIYIAPALFGGDDARPLLAGASVPSMDTLWRGQFDHVQRLGDDLRLDLVPLAADERNI